MFYFLPQNAFLFFLATITLNKSRGPSWKPPSLSFPKSRRLQSQFFFPPFFRKLLFPTLSVSDLIVYCRKLGRTPYFQPVITPG